MLKQEKGLVVFNTFIFFLLILLKKSRPLWLITSHPITNRWLNTRLLNFFLHSNPKEIYKARPRKHLTKFYNFIRGRWKIGGRQNLQNVDFRNKHFIQFKLSKRRPWKYFKFLYQKNFYRLQSELPGRIQTLMRAWKLLHLYYNPSEEEEVVVPLEDEIKYLAKPFKQSRFFFFLERAIVDYLAAREEEMLEEEAEQELEREEELRKIKIYSQLKGKRGQDFVRAKMLALRQETSEEDTHYPKASMLDPAHFFYFFSNRHQIRYFKRLDNLSPIELTEQNFLATRRLPNPKNRYFSLILERLPALLKELPNYNKEYEFPLNRHIFLLFKKARSNYHFTAVNFKGEVKAHCSCGQALVNYKMKRNKKARGATFSFDKAIKKMSQILKRKKLRRISLFFWPKELPAHLILLINRLFFFNRIYIKKTVFLQKTPHSKLPKTKKQKRF